VSATTGPVSVLGAGPAGRSAADRLVREGRAVAALEAEPVVDRRSARVEVEAG
jgi:NADPH-dependent glutamate synthase beta subunit-like oxidoreductase